MTPEQLRQRRRERKIIHPIHDDELIHLEMIFGTVEMKTWFDEDGYGWGMSTQRDSDGNITKVTTSKTGVRIVME